MGPKNKKGVFKKNGKDSYLADDQNFQSFSNQLAKLGLELRDITGDGNCCFRAISDQMEGNEKSHLEYRHRVCMYMRQNRDEFEPFVAALIDDDDEENHKKLNKKLDAFEKYIKNLEQPGCYADNGCLVAFARLYQVDINIHQLNLPIWTIHGSEPKRNQIGRQLHLSYHNGEHYSSIRPIGDRTNTPTNINIGSILPPSPAKNKKPNAANNYYEEFYDNYASDIEATQELSFQNLNVDQIMNVTDCHDVNLIVEMLKENSNDLEKTIIALTGMKIKNDGESGSGEEANGDNKSKSDKKDSKKNKREKKVEKKQRQMERQRTEVLKQKEAAESKTAAKTNKANEPIRQEIACQENEPDLNILINNVQVNSI